ncbi:hypothetical protein ACAG39_12365 [Caldicellulosiruptoraceae bacterium PP1]
MNIEQRQLTDSDMIKFIETIGITKFEKSCNYMDPFINKHIFNEFILREKFFNYSIYVFGEFSENTLTKISYYQLPNIGTLSKSAELQLLICGNEKTEAAKFLSNSFLNLNKSYPDISKIKINIKNNIPNLDYILNLLSIIGFQKELVLEKEFDDADLIIYSYFIK